MYLSMYSKGLYSSACHTLKTMSKKMQTIMYPFLLPKRFPKRHFVFLYNYCFMIAFQIKIPMEFTVATCQNVKKFWGYEYFCMHTRFLQCFDLSWRKVKSGRHHRGRRSEPVSGRRPLEKVCLFVSLLLEGPHPDLHHTHRKRICQTANWVSYG
ncbi:hypothetical protein CHARACLAT_022211 [Characodon lateralis]|uniref:Uncharacterized protein n=1 Tax=Characodon lateralis TaxID=208331 RepID=A0ABU7DCQ2_9TELE|nr:hypothetical protein [Characodon lateralis]